MFRTQIKWPPTLALFLLALSFMLQAAEVPDSAIYGRVEEALLLPEKKILRAKLDTGAKSSSIDARNLEFHLRHGERWVRFDVYDRERKIIRLDRPVIGTVKIKKRPSDGSEQTPDLSSTERPTVQLKFCIHDQVLDIVINLADRSGFLFPVILGRDDMKNLHAWLNPKLRMTQSPHCIGIEENK